MGHLLGWEPPAGGHLQAVAPPRCTLLTAEVEAGEAEAVAEAGARTEAAAEVEACAEVDVVAGAEEAERLAWWREQPGDQPREAGAAGAPYC
jgi:hypothetical protein